MKHSYGEYIPLLKAISDETRLKILDMLSCGEMCAGDILEEFQISQSTLSYHMKILSDCGLVQGTKAGSWIRYTLEEDRAAELIGFLGHITSPKEECICHGVWRSSQKESDMNQKGERHD